jgi:pyrimidine-specific ribonucleoside hydrolase
MKKIILDCDPGHDDAFAIMLAAKHLEVIGITTIGGNTTLENVTKNALKILELIGREDIPVYAGHDRPMIVPLVTAPQFHGVTGLDGPVLPEPKTKKQDKHAVDFIIETVRNTGDVTIVATGPLTNVACALHRAPDIIPRIREISIMGGSVTYGNWTPAAEFNIFVDPEAAYRVFNSGVHVKMSGITLTRQCALSSRHIEEIRAIPTRTAKIAAELLDFFSGTHKTAALIEDAIIHDACAVAWLIDPALIIGVGMHITVELTGTYTRGMTVCDYRHLRGKEPLVDISRTPTMDYRGEKPNATAGLQFDLNRFLILLYDTLRAYP